MSIDKGGVSATNLSNGWRVVDFRVVALFNKDKYFGQGKHTHDGDQKVDAVVEVHVSKAEPRHARLPVNAYQRQRQSNGRSKGRLRLVAAGNAAQGCKGQHKHAEVLGGTKQERYLNQLGGQKDQAPGGKESTDK